MTMHRRLCASSVRRFHGQSVQTALSTVRARLSVAGVTGTSDAKALVANALAPKLVSSNELVLFMDRVLQSDEAQRLERMTQRRVDGEPLAYVVGTKEFWSLVLSVTRDTLIPRPDSECLIEALATMYPKSSRLRILDLGTGSGALLLAALSEYPLATGVGLDISNGALAVATANAARLGFGDRAEFIEGDMEELDPVLQQHQFDVILCNPPYIPLTEVPLIAPDVLAYEPHGALFSAGPDAWKRKTEEQAEEGDDIGLRFYVALRDSVDKLLDPASTLSSAVIVEIGSERQAHAVKNLFADVASVAFDRFLLDAGGRHRGVVSILIPKNLE